MNEVEEQIAIFVEAVQRHHEATLSGDWRVTHTEGARFDAAAKVVLAKDEVCLERFAELLKHKEASVRCMAACYLIKHRQRECLWTLRRIRWFDRGILGLEAKYALRRFREGNLEM